jgi:hypothetical protein
VTPTLGLGQVAIEGLPNTPSTGGVGGAGGMEPSDGFAGAAGGAGAPPLVDIEGVGGVSGSAPAPTPAPMPDPDALLGGLWDDNLNMPSFLAKLNEVIAANTPGALGFTRFQHETAAALAAERVRSHQHVDVALLLDTTGSMGDELAYLQKELPGLWQAVTERYPNATQRWALVAYRDQGDNYVTLTHQFTESRDQFLSSLGELIAEGGGDVPEGTEQALAELNNLGWHDDDATLRLAFWFTDAPHHPERAGLVASELTRSQDRGIAIYPVASANTEVDAVWHLRVAAQWTGGRYMFALQPVVSAPTLTTVPPCFFVSEVVQSMQRVLAVGMDGQYVAPLPETVFGTHGYPMNGVCTLGSGNATAF